ncbi:MAG: Gfo/Idh/MocA family oxidoreductase [Kiritimatiellae bacterium]|nr:Gfo/Idh/MocA family oxidoreductase [Kiritimatiellia bacterium]
MIKIAMIGLDTSHCISFPKLMQAPDCPEPDKVPGLRVTTCLRFLTPFTNTETLDKRQQQLEAWGVKVTTRLDEALEGCDAILLEINDGAYHLEYFKKVAALGKPVFIDKPLATTLEDGRAIIALMRKHKTRVWSGSGLPFCPEVVDISARMPQPRYGHVFGVLNKAPDGDGLIWYGVHVFETLQKIMGPGARTARATENANGIVTVIDYGNGRQGLIENLNNCKYYGGCAQGDTAAVPFVIKESSNKRPCVIEIRKFFEGGPAPVEMATTFEGLSMMVAARQSITTGQTVKVPQLAG